MYLRNKKQEEECNRDGAYGGGVSVTDFSKATVSQEGESIFRDGGKTGGQETVKETVSESSKILVWQDSVYWV